MSETAGGRPATLLAALWAGALVLLAALWVMSPFTGPSTMFLGWSVAAAPLMAWSWSRFRRWRVHQLPTGTGFLAAVAVVWALVAALAASGIGAELALDGLVMRNAVQRTVGRGLHWSPGIFGLVVAVAGLAASLEARYRLARRGTGQASARPDQRRSSSVSDSGGYDPAGDPSER